MAILGPRSLLDIAVPTGVDANELMRFNMEQGITAEEAMGMATTAIGEANVFLSQRYGGILAFTNRAFARYYQGQGTRSMTPTKSEFAVADPVRGDNVGHMLPREDYEDAIAWSASYIKRADRELLRDDVRVIRDRWQNRVDYDILVRALTRAETAIGAAGWSVGWVDGQTSNVEYIPPQYRGFPFDNTHSHYIRTDGALNAGNAIATLNNAAETLQHHGHHGRLVAMVSFNDITVYQGMDAAAGRFVQIVPGQFTATGATGPAFIAGGETEGVPGELFGYFLGKLGVIEMRWHERIPTRYGFVTKSYGINSPQNGIAVRTDPEGFGLMVKPELKWSLTPELEKVQFLATHGVGVNDRLNGVAFQVAASSTTYSDPDIV